MKYLSLFLILFFAFSVHGATFTVNLTSNQNDAQIGDRICDIDLNAPGSQCTLRAAISEAEDGLDSGDHIDFNLPPNSTITIGGISIADSVSITGTGANNLTINSGGNFPAFIAIRYRPIAISGMTISGGGVRSSGGSLTLDRVHIKDSSPNGWTGSSGTLKITNSTVSGSSGCAFYIDGQLIVENSTISGNGTGFCGPGSTTIRNTTVTNNNGSGVSNGYFSFANSIIAGNNGNPYPDIDFTLGSITSNGNNIIGDSPGDAMNTNRAVTYQPSDILDANPLLGILQNNGGTTPTHALLPGSPAIDKGNNANSPGAFDQRGFARIVNSVIDIGAVESETAVCSYSLSQSSTNILASGGAGSFTITTQNGCSFTSVSGNDFLTIDSGATGTGTTQVNFFVQANTTGVARTGTITVGSQTFTINQAAGKSRKRIRFI